VVESQARRRRQAGKYSPVRHHGFAGEVARGEGRGTRARDDANAARKKTEAAYAAARKATADAKAAFTAANKKAKAQEAIDAAWTVNYAGTLVHEEGHRRICYFYADKLTDMLNHLRAWGYAPTKERAEELGFDRFRVAYRKEVTKILAQDIAMQAAYDAPDGSDHGQKQEKWNWSRLK
jgi:hypothetical protein